MVSYAVWFRIRCTDAGFSQKNRVVSDPEFRNLTIMAKFYYSEVPQGAPYYSALCIVG